MELTAPRTFEEILLDGHFAQADSTWAFQHNLGNVQRVEFRRAGGNYEVVAHSDKGVFGFESTTVATISNGTQWTWLHSYDFDIPQIRGTHEFQERLLQAARTLHGNAPIFRAQRDETEEDVIVLKNHQLRTPLDTAVKVGLAQLPEDASLNERDRALLAFAAHRGCNYQRDDQHVTLSDATSSITLDATTLQLPQQLHLNDLLADAHYMAVEQAYFVDATLPGARLVANLNHPSSTLQTQGNSTTVDAVLLAVEDLKTGRFQWSWDHPTLASTMSVRRARGVQQFALDYGVREFLRPEADPAAFKAAMPVLRRWLQLECPVSEHERGIFLVAGGTTTLPPLREDVAQVVLQQPVSAGLDQSRAEAAYRRFRQSLPTS